MEHFYSVWAFEPIIINTDGSNLQYLQGTGLNIGNNWCPVSLLMNT